MRYGVGAWPWYLLALVVIGLDQYSKGLASASLEYAQPVPVFSWFNLTLHHNTGAAFSFLSDAGGWQRYFFTGIAAVVSGLLVVWIYRLQRGQWLLALSLALVLGGAIGNVWDRLVLGYVVDFISVHYAGYYFPAFNLADSAITGGAIGMILDTFLGRPEGGTKED
ncbi:lipoprotein signal peptidase [Parahaliea maris]|uniref:Lipoprotein signal peptidase n=1 Tax=Parahaliea maris TaxID=2716870 RepID=A0A5C8ZUA5_9GAMM|nr:signal peptidase II [Parahaliea maris]TXS91354.1 lipoprotein signal peptidase [Parahaliea maris]